MQPHCFHIPSQLFVSKLCVTRLLQRHAAQTAVSQSQLAATAMK